MSEHKENREVSVPEAATAGEDPKKGAAKKTKKDAVKKEGEGLEDQLKAAQTAAEENRERLLRVTAEFENYKKRMEREMNDFRKFANESLIKEILPIVDNLERAVETPNNEAEDAFNGLKEGVQMTLKGLLDCLEHYGVVPMESLNRPFDPNFHQAVMQEESEAHSDNTVVQELQKGYLIRDRLLRPAMVVVSKRPVSDQEVRSQNSEDAQKIEIKIQ
ncbi:MAG: nucleotide exchange factor GrpE [Deltaproteobacteria bacterium]